MTASRSATARGRHRTWRTLLTVHAGIVLLLLALFLVLLVPSMGEPDANIGAGLVLLPLLALGVPWSLPHLVDPYQFDALPRALWCLVVLGPAAANVVLHAAVRAVVGRRAASRRASPA